MIVDIFKITNSILKQRRYKYNGENIIKSTTHSVQITSTQKRYRITRHYLFDKSNALNKQVNIAFLGYVFNNFPIFTLM